MSAECLFRAVKAKVGNPQRKLVLIVLADIANESHQCWPSHQYIADRAECSKRSVINHLKALESDGFISIKNRATEDGKSATNYYTVLDSMGVKEIHPSPETPANTGVQEIHPRGGRVQHLHGEGAAFARGEGAAVAHNTPTLITLPIDTPTSGGDLFAAFWDAWPKRVNKSAAQKAFQKLNPTPEITSQLVADIRKRLDIGEWVTDHRKQYIPNPATYLNGRLWENEYIPRADFEPEPDFSAIARDAQEFEL